MGKKDRAGSWIGNEHGPTDLVITQFPDLENRDFGVRPVPSVIQNTCVHCSEQVSIQTNRKTSRHDITGLQR